MDYRKIGAEDVEVIAIMTAHYLTEGEYVVNSIRKAAARGIYFGVKAMEGGRMTGYLTLRSGIDFTVPHPELERKIRGLAREEEICTGDAFYVSPQFRRRGIGSELTRLSRQYMVSLGFRYFMGELWIHPDGGIPAGTPTELYGQTIFEEYVPLFYKDLPRYGMRCPICGENCRCGAVLRLVRL